MAVGRICTWAVLVPPRAGMGWWTARTPTQQLVLGFALYSLAGTLLLCLPFAQRQPGRPIDHLFNIVSAVSTTGLTTMSVGDCYTMFGQAVILALFQAGGIGFMTLSSVLVLARGRPLSHTRLGVLRAGFALPHYFNLRHFIVQVVVFTLVCETIGSALLWWRFSLAGSPDPLWSAVFHSVSAFATAGFSLHNDSLEKFASDWTVNLTIGTLSYLGAIGFIVVQDVWYSIRLRERMLTFTSRTILWMTLCLFLLGTSAMYAFNPSIRALPLGDGLLAAAFQAMTASTTAGFNTVPIGSMPAAALVVLLVLMLVGASPSGTGGGIKTTTVSAILANLWSILRSGGRGDGGAVAWLGHEVPLPRVLLAFATASLYLILLIVGVLALTLTEESGFLPIVFEAASAIGTVGLSMGMTADLSTPGKLVIIALMFAGRCGPLTIGLALVKPVAGTPLRADDLAI